ncbi:MAG: metallophosphoesterase [Gemmatimonadota bacterium]|nr:metallophosphoesterase [Gemmatimonadota bacterium]
MTRAGLLSVLAVMGIATTAPSVAVALQQAEPVQRFVVLGHVRSEPDRLLHPRLDELLDEVRALDPDFAILSGDNIWGDVANRPNPADGGWVLEQWVALDSALATLGVPVYRVPGNHDIHDAVTREIYRDRYGALPAVVDVDGTRLILLTTSWDDGRPERRRANGFGYHLDDDQVTFLRQRLAETDEYDRVFVVMHHLLWWEADDSPWWTEVHPILARAGVTAVFTGDYGPAKFSNTERDGVLYFQSGIAPNPSLEILRGHEWNRLLAQQFDNFLVVDVTEDEVAIDVETTGIVSSGHFTRERWWDVHGDIMRPPEPGGREHLGAIWAIPRGRVVIVGALGACGVGGLLLGWLIGARRRRRIEG